MSKQIKLEGFKWNGQHDYAQFSYTQCTDFKNILAYCGSVVDDKEKTFFTIWGGGINALLCLITVLKGCAGTNALSYLAPASVKKNFFLQIFKTPMGRLPAYGQVWNDCQEGPFIFWPRHLQQRKNVIRQTLKLILAPHSWQKKSFGQSAWVLILLLGLKTVLKGSQDTRSSLFWPCTWWQKKKKFFDKVPGALLIW